MSAFISNSTVNRQEAETLKEMIFNRVRARAEEFNKETQESYTTNIQYDVMDIARDSFISTKNPFSTNITTENKANEIKEEEKISNSGLGFEVSSKKVPNTNNQAINYEIVQKTVNDNMNTARNELCKNSSFVGALNFLNSQASIVLIEKRGKNFIATA